MKYKKHWFALVFVILSSFAVLGYSGWVLYQKAPPVPKKIQTHTGRVLYTGKDVMEGQAIWQSIGGQQLGSIWGHGAYNAPDWTADWLHREALWLLERWAQQKYSIPYKKTNEEQKGLLKARLRKELRTNTYDPKTGILRISDMRAQAFAHLQTYYARLFSAHASLNELREAYAMPKNVIPSAKRREKLGVFFFWATWACVTQRPNQKISYTHNWPPEPLVGNEPTGPLIWWSILSIILLLAGVGALVWYFAFKEHMQHEPIEAPDTDPFLRTELTPSMKATQKYFWVVMLLILLQIALGIITAHYGVEGTGLYGIPIGEYIPYAVTRTWHVQLGIFWVATAWLATGLYIAPRVSSVEPPLQKAGVNLLFFCLLVIVGGSLFGTWYATRQKLGLNANFWFGHQGYEYVELGRFWQIFLVIGLIVWFILMVRALLPAIKKAGEHKSLLLLFLMASAAIPLFYSAGLMSGQHSHMSIAEYWRWWVVHLWVEGFFEVFATVVVAFLFTKLGLLRTSSATSAALFSTTIFLTGGILGTLHHIYFAGTPVLIMALGSTFSALEVVPLVLIGFEAYENLRLSRANPWVQKYKWPILFFVSVSFWNMVGAGLFGFLINPPVALYYMQGLNTTAVHGHSAFFGVYGMLGIGLMLFCLRTATSQKLWKEKYLSIAFWSLNVGLGLMIVMSLLPIGLWQTWASLEQGMWYARSADLLQKPAMQTLKWLRAVGDTIFAIGAVALAWFLLGLYKGWSYSDNET